MQIENEIRAIVAQLTASVEPARIQSLDDSSTGPYIEQLLAQVSLLRSYIDQLQEKELGNAKR